MWKYLDRYWKFRSGLRREVEGGDRDSRANQHMGRTWCPRRSKLVKEVRGTRKEVPG